MKDLAGPEVATMQTCGHDVHMTGLTGTARMLVGLKDRWFGTAVLVRQPAEERGIGARGMRAEGLYQKFSKPDFAIALHGSAGTIEGNAMDIVVLELLARPSYAVTVIQWPKIGG